MTTFTATNVSGPTGWIQTYLVPDTGPYFIRAYGAQGGGSNGGLGAMESGVFNLTAGDSLKVLVGQRPLGNTGGGGGTFVVLDNGTPTPLLVAAGGGGSSPGFSRSAFMDGQASTPPLTEASGLGGENSGAPGGSSGNGGGPSPGVADVCGSGGGFSTSGDNATNAVGAPIADTGGKGFLQGGVGGDPISGQQSSGGFGGGGGGAAHAAGGGGGYNGGGGARYVNTGLRAAGGGGGSYNSGASREGESGVRTGEGEVLITLIAQPQPPANVTATPVGTDVEVCWESPGEEAVWSDLQNVYTEIRRRDCEGEQHIATLSPQGGSSVLRTNLARDPRATVDDIVGTNGVGWKARWYGPDGAGTTTVVTGATDGPLPGVTSYLRKTWTTAPSINGDTGFDHSTGTDMGGGGTAGDGIIVFPGETYTISSYVRASAERSGSFSVNVTWRDATGGSLFLGTVGAAVNPIAGQWVRVSETVTVPPGAYRMCPFTNFYGGNQDPWQPGDTLDGTALLVEQSPALLDYFDGSTANTSDRLHEWTGTPDASTSVQLLNPFVGCFVDRFAPLSGSRETCADPAHTCEVTYQVRYVGLVSGVADPPSLVPEGFIVGYDGPLEEIPSGWTRVSALNGRYPKGATGLTSGSTGGALTHTHTSPGHSHEFDSHRHSLPANTGGSTTASISTKRWEGSSGQRFSAPRGGVGGHTHPVGGFTAYFPRTPLDSPARGNTLSSSPSTSSAGNEPLNRTAVFIQSDGTPTSLPSDSFVLGTSTPADFEAMTPFHGRYLKGAAAGSPGGGLGGTSTHTHTLNAHTHGTPAHSHPSTAGGGNYGTGSNGLTSASQYWVSLVTTAGGTRLVREAASPDGIPPTSFPGVPLVTHQHEFRVNDSTYGTTSSNGTSASTAAANRPLARTLRVLRPTTGRIRTGLLGMWLGDASLLPSGLTRCDGTNGTPDMRGRYVEGSASGAPGQAVGGNTHTHTVPAHTHTLPTHSHSLTLLPFAGLTMRAVSDSATNSRSSASHSHSLANTSAVRPPLHAAPAQTLNSVTVEPPFSEVHFVRIDAVGTSPLNEEVVQATEDGEASTTVIAPDEDMALLKHPALDVELLGCPDVNWARIRPFEATQALQGGMPTVIVGDPGGRDYGLSFTVDEAGKDALETILSATLFWMQPARGAAGWFTAAPWQVTEMKSSPAYWQVDVTVTETEPQAVPLAESLL